MAYDVKALVEKLKGRGLNIAEDAAKGAASDVLGWFADEVKKSPTPFDDIVLIVVDQLKIALEKELDKIDGQVG